MHLFISSWQIVFLIQINAFCPPVNSISEPSLFTSEPKVTQPDRFPHRRRPPPRKRTPQMPLCRLCDPDGRSQSCKPTYTHFSYPIRPAVKLSPTPSRSQSTPTSHLGARRLVFASPLPLDVHQGALSVRGTPCLPPQPTPPVQPAQGRAQLHVFLPTEMIPTEEVDSESVDEGFMDELDNKVTCLRIHQGIPKPPVQWEHVSDTKANKQHCISFKQWHRKCFEHFYTDIELGRDIGQLINTHAISACQ